jgi:hypothetical protein
MEMYGVNLDMKLVGEPTDRPESSVMRLMHFGARNFKTARRTMPDSFIPSNFGLNSLFFNLCETFLSLNSPNGRLFLIHTLNDLMLSRIRIHSSADLATCVLLCF